MGCPIPEGDLGEVGSGKAEEKAGVSIFRSLASCSGLFHAITVYIVVLAKYDAVEELHISDASL